MKNQIQVSYRNLFRCLPAPKSFKTSAIIVMLASLLDVSANAQLLHRYDFNTANDTVGTANGTLLNGATLSGGALITDGGNGATNGAWGGTGQMMTLASSAVGGITNAFTLETWFQCTTGWPKYDSLFAFSDGTTANTLLGVPVMGYGPWPSGFNIAGGGGSNSVTVRGIYLDNNAKHQVLLTYDGTNFTYYVDGVLANFSGFSATASDPGFNLSSLTDLGINGGSPWGDPILTGSTYDFRIYGQGVSALQVAQIYALGSDANNSDITAIVTPAPATAFTWNGGGSDNNWGTGLNWVGGTAPTTNGTILTFAGSNRTSPNLETGYNVNSLIFSNNASSFTIGSAGGSVLKLTGIPVEVDSANPQTLNLTVADNGVGLVKSGSGTLNLSGANTYIGQTIVSNGTLNISGSLASTANITIGDGVGNSVLGVSGTISPNLLLVGNVSNAVSVVSQTGGTLNATANTGVDNLSVGNVAGAYGYFDAVGGTANINGICVAGENGVGATGGNGVMDVNGGTVNCSGWFVVARNGNAQTGVVNVYNGSLTYAGGGMVCNWGSGQTTMINVMGGSLATANGSEIGFLGGTGILNLLGGVTTVGAVNGAWGAPNGQVNFNGGTLQANVNTAIFLAVTGATIYGGGGTIDNAGWPIAISQPLLAPAGNGVHAITAFSGGAGYIAPPIVAITPGTGDTTGTNATAIAQINPATGTVTNILITCPGGNYTATPTFTFAGGGATTPASVTGVTLAPNTSGGLTFIGSDVTTLSGANTYTGSTTINNTTLALIGSLNSTNIIISSGSTLDVSSTNITLGNQALSGFGNVNGSLNTSAGSKIYGGTDGTYGTLTFNNNLTLVSGAACFLDLGTVYNGVNDKIVVTGALTNNGNVIHLKAPSTSSSLDASADYVLITASSITGSFAAAPVWDVAPANAGHYSIVTSGTAVTLHYSASVSPLVTATANPTTLLRNQTTRITATVTPGVNSISSVTVNLSAVGGSVISLVRSNLSNIYTNTVMIPAASATGGASLTVVATDTASLSGSTGISVTINASSEVWNGGGANQNWSTNPNWVSGLAPGLIGDDLTFAGSTALAPNMDANYSATGLTFSNNASSFTLGTANSSTLTLTANGILNNSANTQTINVPLNLSAVESVNAAAGNIAIGSTISGAGGITKIGANTLTLSGNNSAIGGRLTVNAGAMSVTGSPFSVGNIHMATVAGAAATGLLNLNGTVVNNSAETVVCDGQNGAASGQGTLNVNSGSILNSESDLLLSFAGAGTGSANIAAGATVNVASTTKRWVIVNVWDTSQGQLTVNGGTLNLNAGTDIQFSTGSYDPGASASTSYVTLNSGAITAWSGNQTGAGSTGVLNLNNNASRAVNNTFNLNGGTLTIGSIVSGRTTGARVFNFNGGTLKPTAASATFFAAGAASVANVRNGGAIIDDGGFTITIAQALVHSSVGGDNATDGGLTKNGTGTLTLSGANTYTGNTIINAGTLELAQAVLATNASVTISNAAVLQLDLATTNTIAGLVLNGTNQAPGLYNSTTAAPFLTGAGSLLVASTIASNPTNISFTVTGGTTLTLSWPTDHLGWILQQQTNSLSVGLGTNWVDVAGSSSVTSTNLTISHVVPTAFYRLRHP